MLEWSAVRVQSGSLKRGASWLYFLIFSKLDVSSNDSMIWSASISATQNTYQMYCKVTPITACVVKIVIVPVEDPAQHGLQGRQSWSNREVHYHRQFQTESVTGRIAIEECDHWFAI